MTAIWIPSLSSEKPSAVAGCACAVGWWPCSRSRSSISLPHSLLLGTHDLGRADRLRLSPEQATPLALLRLELERSRLIRCDRKQVGQPLKRPRHIGSLLREDHWNTVTQRARHAAIARDQHVRFTP